MSDSSLGLIVRFDRLISQIIQDHPDRAIELLLCELSNCSDRESFIAALISQLVIAKVRIQFDRGAI